MVDSNGKPIDTRTTVGGETPGAIVPGSGATTPPASNPPAIQPEGTSTSTKVTTTTRATTPVSTEVPAQYKVSSYAELIPELEKRIAEFKPLTDDELKKLRRRQKAEGIISGISDAVQSVANLMFTRQYAPNMYNPKEGMSAKAKERFEKDKAQREADADKFFNYAMQIGRLKDADRERGLQIWNTEQTLARQDRAYDDGRKDRAEDVAFRNKDYDERVRQWQAGFDRAGEWHEEEGRRWERQFKESVRQFNISSANERTRINLESQRLAHSLKEGQMTFNLGSGNGNVTLTMDKLNAQTVSRIYHTLPASVRQNVHGDPIVQNGVVVDYKPPTTEAMLIAIGANVESSPATQNAIKQVAGLEKGQKPAGY